MGNTLADIEIDLPLNGLGLESVLDFVRLLPTSDPLVVKEMIQGFVERNREFTSVDDTILNRIYNDLDIHGRIQPETIQGLPPRPNISLDKRR